MGIYRVFLFIICASLSSCSSSPQKVPELIKTLEGQNPKKAYQALIQLTRLEDPQALEAVIQYSARKPPEIRIQAILAARQFKSPKALPWLFVLSTGDSDENVRHAASEAFKAIEKKSSI